MEVEKNKVKPLNGRKTLPLTIYAYAALERMVTKGPVPRVYMNAGLSTRLEREDLGEWVELPNPVESNREERPTYPYFQITDVGRARLAAYLESKRMLQENELSEAAG